jgi:hypothetical protein
MQEAVTPSQCLFITLCYLANGNTFENLKTDSKRINIPQYCPQIIQCFQDCTIKIKLHLIDTMYCEKLQHQNQIVNSTKQY